MGTELDVLMALNPLVVAAGMGLAGKLFGGKKKKDEAGLDPIRRRDVGRDIEEMARALKRSRKRKQKEDDDAL